MKTPTPMFYATPPLWLLAAGTHLFAYALVGNTISAIVVFGCLLIAYVEWDSGDIR